LIVNLGKFSIFIYIDKRSIHLITFFVGEFRLVLEKSNHDEFNPPIEFKNLVGKHEKFEKIGKVVMEGFIKFGNLTPDEDFLDVGCGCGRMAIPLTKYLKNGKYEGFDVNPRVIVWCKENIEPKFPNFNFSFIDIKNSSYNVEGKIDASNVRFPFEDQSFDFVSLASIFTHMLPNDLKNYFKEIARVLRNNGRCYITYFLINDESRKLIDSGISQVKFQHKLDGFYSVSLTKPLVAVAYDEKFIRSLYEENNLKIIEPIFYGNWPGRDSRDNTEHGQDLIIATKNSKP